MTSPIADGCMPEPARLILIRHAQASLGSRDYDRLSARGQLQARALADRLAPLLADSVELWSGTLRRHHQTLAPVAGRGRAVERTADLDEFATAALVRSALKASDRAELSAPPREKLADPARHLPELLAWFPEVLAAWQQDALDVARVGRWDDFRQRVTRAEPAWRTAVDNDRSVVVFSSAGVIATVLAALAGKPLAWQRSVAVQLYNASLSEMRRVEGRWVVSECNCVAHLADPALRTLA